MGRESFRKRLEIIQAIRDIDPDDIPNMMLDNEDPFTLLREIPIDEYCDLCDIRKWVQVVLTEKEGTIHICKPCYISGNWSEKLTLNDFLFF